MRLFSWFRTLRVWNARSSDRRANVRKARIESLEERWYLSASLPETGGLELKYADTVLAAEAVDVPGGGSIESSIDALYAVLNTRDLGDFYWSGTEKVPLWRADDELVIGFDSEADSTSLLETFTGAEGILQGYDTLKSLGTDTVVLSRTANAPIGEVDLESLRMIDGVAWTGPVFTFGENGSWTTINDEVIVALNSGTRAADFFSTPEFSGFHPLLGTPDQFVGTLAVGGGLDTLAAANQLHLNPRVAWAAPNGTADFQVAVIPNDPLFGDQWHLNNTSQFDAKLDADADAAEGWDTTTGSSDIVIAVIDDGVQTNHPDLNIFTNPDEIAANGIDDDGNGWIDDVNGWNFVATGAGNNNANPNDMDDNHGTAVAGVAGAVGNNSLGVSGSAQNVTILPVKVAQGGVFQNFDRIATAVYYAAGRTADGLSTWDAADILNASFGAGGVTSHAALDTAFNWAATGGRSGLGATVIAAAGNSAAGRQGSGTEQYNGIARDVDVSAFGIASWSWVVSYNTNASVTDGEDTIRLGRFVNDDGTNTRWDSLTAPTGWILTPFAGQDGWYIEDNPARAHGTGRYQARSTNIVQDDVAYIMAPSIATNATTNPTMSATFYTWQSSEVGDTMKFQLWNHNTGRLFDITNGTVAGVVPTLVQTVDVDVAYPANIVDHTIAVGASTDWDYRSHYSQYGTRLHLVAPSSGGYASITTTDRTGADGYDDPSDYTSTFGGTSAAAPLTAGIAALMLAKNPYLTAQEVRTILQDSADQIGGVTYTNDRNDFYGHGRVNAEAALDAIYAFTVDSPDDAVDASLGDGIAEDISGNVTLRAAIQEANADPTHSYTIILPEEVYSLDLMGDDDIAAVGDLDITGDVTIIGVGAGLSVIDGGGAAGLGDRLLSVLSGGNLSLSRVTLTGAYNNHNGAAVLVLSGGELSIDRSAVVDNNSYGGALYVLEGATSVSITNSVIANNTATTSTVGGIRTDMANTKIGNTIIANNFLGANPSDVFEGGMNGSFLSLGNNLLTTNFGATGSFIDGENGDQVGLVDPSVRIREKIT